ncbi:hypothetical protein PI125_g21972 [Phytophthora idaei]|nr:hypothetical protein PI125_g21972 [Phytophthora idaei]KAG3130954.1 hypothetical protein PI126_g20269 [Phytophthora idaei]
METTHACVAVKVGEFGHTSRASVPVEDAEFEFDEGRDNFERVYSIADGMVSSALAKYTTKTTRPDMKLYLTLSQHAKQAQFMALTSETWPGMLTQARTNYHKQKTFDGPFVVHLLMYAAKKYAKAFVVRLRPALPRRRRPSTRIWLSNRTCA